jgi:hypothetical protein
MGVIGSYHIGHHEVAKHVTKSEFNGVHLDFKESKE